MTGASPPASGSSPLARGLRAAILIEEVGEGIIPARAGFTESRGQGRRSAWDHPRSRGVYLNLLSPTLQVTGSSPLARGLRASRPLWTPTGRIIPARAGFTACQLVARACHQDHPRSRGVYPSRRAWTGSWMGSSPLARGLPAAARTRAKLTGIIPARAGFTRTSKWNGESSSDHPRSRGVYDSKRMAAAAVTGSSPLARGLPITTLIGELERRIIPARAGFT